MERRSAPTEGWRRQVTSLPLILAGLLVFGLVGCGGGGGHIADNGETNQNGQNGDNNQNGQNGDNNQNGQNGGDPGAGTTSYHGRVLAPNGVTPIAGARVVYAGPGQPAAGSRQSDGVGDTAVGNPGQETPEATTDVNGEFTLHNVPKGLIQIDISTEFLHWTATVDTEAEENPDQVMPRDNSQLASRIAVVTGEFDRLEDVLGKLGFGEVDGEGHLIRGSEKWSYDGEEYARFDIYNGWNFGAEGTSGYANLTGLFANPDWLDLYDIVFINSGAMETDWAGDSTEVTNLRNYVANGGRLYVTDRAYDYVEQVFPEAIDFFGSDETPAEEPEEPNAAEVGLGGRSDASVPQTGLADWLRAVGGLSGGTVSIGGLVTDWAVINSLPATTHALVEGPVGWQDHSLEAVMQEGTRTLAAHFTVGSGDVIFTSFPSAASPSLELTPQEMIVVHYLFGAWN